MNDIRFIKLPHDKWAVVDADLFPELNRHSWQMNKRGYVVRSISNPARVISMHREANHTPKGLKTDHINECKFDNTSRNLRSCNNSQNVSNKGMPRTNTSGFKGVSWSRLGKKWVAQIEKDGKAYYLGLFESKEEAAKTYNAACVELHGEFAKPNASV